MCDTFFLVLLVLFHIGSLYAGVGSASFLSLWHAHRHALSLGLIFIFMRKKRCILNEQRGEARSMDDKMGKGGKKCYKKQLSLKDDFSYFYVVDKHVSSQVIEMALSIFFFA